MSKKNDLFTVRGFKSADIVKRLHKLETGGEVAIQRTVSDFTSRAPAWVSKGIREHYGIDAQRIKQAQEKPRRGKTTIKVAGITVDGATLIYKDRLLTPVHFKMSPKQRPEGQQKTHTKIPGQLIASGSPVAMMNQPKRYNVKATIIKGEERATFPAGTFLAPASKTDGEKPATIIPWQRTGNGREAWPIKTVSIPQMIDGRAHDTIYEAIEQKLGERFQHHIERVMK